jgi:predicted CopG family antitoxin
MLERTTISVSKQTHKQLCEIGKKGETFDTIIRRLIDFYVKYGEEVSEAVEGKDPQTTC